MSNSTTNLDLISASQASKEVTANSLFDAASPAMLYGRRAVTTAGLTWGYYGGTVMAGGVPTQIANGTVALTPSATNYVEADPSTGAVSVNTTSFTPGHTPLYQAITGTGTVESYADLRILGGGNSSAPVESVNSHTGAVVLTASDVGADASGAASDAIAAHDAATDPHPQYLTSAEGDSRYAPSTAATGVSSVNGHTGTVTLAASDVGAVATSALGVANGAASLDSGGKLPAAQLPDLAVTDYLGTVATQTAMLALTGQKGDWAIRSDNGKVYVITGADPTSVGSWTALSYPTGTGGTVTSVDLAVPGLLYTVSGNPVSTSGTLTFALKTQVKNTFLAGPATGADATPTMRALAAADLPVMGASGTGHAAGAVPDPGATAGTTRFLREDGAWATAGGGGLTNWSEGIGTSAPNATVPVVSLTAANAATNVDAVISPKGTGGLAANIADNAATGGNKRGQSSIDWQITRTAANQVASGAYAAIAGGGKNSAAGDYSFAAGEGSTASGANAVAFGHLCTASGIAAFSHGWSNTATNTGAVAMGESCTASGQWSACFGKGSVASGTLAFACSDTTKADGDYSFASGSWSWTRGLRAARAHSGWVFSNGGDCQELKLNLVAVTTDATPKALSTNNATAGSTNQLTVQFGSSVVVIGKVVARSVTSNYTASWTFQACIKRDSSVGTTSMVAACTPTLVAADSGASSWALSVTADTTNNALKVQFTGAASTTIRVGCTLEAFEIVA